MHWQPWHWQGRWHTTGNADGNQLTAVDGDGKPAVMNWQRAHETGAMSLIEENTLWVS
jgi:hypothetical protein